jgi:hypothetical protein
MKLVFVTRGEVPKGREIFNQKIAAKHAVPRRSGQRRDKLGVSKRGYLIEIEFSCANDEAGYLTFTESELLMLTKLCRRGRNDEQFLRAIEDAGKDATEIRKSRKTVRI